MKLLTPIGLSLCLTLLSGLLYTDTASAQGKYFGIENRYTYTRWHEYVNLSSANYYEEEFVLNGVQAGYFFAESKLSPIDIHYGAEFSIHPISWYTTGSGESANAMGASIGLLSRIDYPLNNDFGLIARGGVYYLAAVGLGSDDIFHEETFGSYLPTIDLGLGVRLKSVNVFGSDGLSIFYNFSLTDLGVSTDNWYTNTPNSADWDNYSFSISLDFGY